MYWKRNSPSCSKEPATAHYFEPQDYVHIFLGDEVGFTVRSVEVESVPVGVGQQWSEVQRPERGHVIRLTGLSSTPQRQRARRPVLWYLVTRLPAGQEF